VTAETPLLLDTCAAIWIAEAQRLSQAATDALEQAHDSAAAVYVSPITAWEVGLLVSRGRLNLQIEPRQWYRRLFDVLNLREAELSATVLIGSSFLPGQPPRDPADRILAATAREFGYRLVTRDRPLLQYAERGHIQSLAC
jgi:PIN domain nuclease of toxin-antitoxin system